MVDTFQHSDTEGVHAFDANVHHRAVYGFSVTSGGAPSIDTGELAGSNETKNTISITSGNGLVNGTEVSWGSQNVSINVGDSFPRWDVVSVDDTGSLNVTEGTPRVAEPTGETRLSTYRPAPPLVSSQTPLALIWVSAEAELIGSADLFDRRVPSVQPWVNKNFAAEFDVADSGTSRLTNATTLDFGTGLTVSVTDTLAEIDWTGDIQDQVIASPNLTVPFSTNLLNGESIRHPVSVGDSETITVYAWGATTTARTTPSGLEVRLLDNNDTVITKSSTAWVSSTSGITSWTNSSGARDFAVLAIHNGTGSDYTDPDGVGGQFGFKVE